MELHIAKRNVVKLRIGISGASGFGKTYSALLLAYGITGQWDKIAVIDTENNSANLYSDLGPYNVLSLQPPYAPERYISAIKVCEQAGMEVVIIDSISHEWIGTGGCLDIHHKLGGRFQDWAVITPRHQKLIESILSSRCHIITTTRRKIDYSLDMGQNGKTRVIKHGTKEVTREGFEYELTVNFELTNDQHLAKASKDRTGLFMDKPDFLINSATGKKLLNWSKGQSSVSDIEKQIDQCTSLKQLTLLYRSHPSYQVQLVEAFKTKKIALQQGKTNTAEVQVKS